MLQIEDFLSPTQFCQIFGFAYCTLSVHIHKGDIVLHQFADESRHKIKVNVDEALQVMGAIKRQYTGSAFRIIRYGENDNNLEAPLMAWDANNGPNPEVA
jgi:hypothetical protein